MSTRSRTLLACRHLIRGWVKHMDHIGAWYIAVAAATARCHQVFLSSKRQSPELYLTQVAWQGAFMAALYAQGLSWERIHLAVKTYARQIGSVRHLLSDLTLPIISIFSGQGFDRIVRETFAEGAQQIEDLWLRCASGLMLLLVW